MPACIVVHKHLTDIELINLLKKGNSNAFSEIYNRHWEGLYKSAFSLLHDTNASMDIVQDIFIWLWQKRHALEIHSLTSYLKAAVRFKVANHIRSGNIRDSFFDELAGVHSPNVTLTTEDIIEVKELKTIIRQAIDELPEKCREIFLLSRVENLNNQQIAKQLGISVKTVENQMTIALRRVRGSVEPYLISILLVPLVTHA